jgi:hypothetical protein
MTHRNTGRIRGISSISIARFSLALMVTATLLACGGGGGSSPAAAIQNPTSLATLTGTVATGKAYPQGTTLVVTDATGTTVGTGTVTGTDGAYSITLTTTAPVAPLVITAKAEGEETMVSVVPIATTGTANVTPLTDLIAALVSPTGNPATLATDISNSNTATVTNINAALTQVQTLIASVSGVASSSTDNPLTTPFTTNNTGHDRTLGAISVAIKPQGNGTSQIQIATTAAADSTVAGGMDNPITLSTNKGSTTVLSAALPTVTAATLPAPGVDTQIQDLMGRLEACFNQSKATRVSGSAFNSVCKAVFWNNDPTTYKNNGYTVGNGTTDRASSYKGIYNNGDTTTLKFDQAKLLYTAKKTVSGTDLYFPVVRYRWTASFPCSTGSTETCYNTDVSEGVFRADAAGKLYEFGNQSNYDLSASARSEYRDLPNLKDSAGKNLSYFSSGYQMWFKDWGDSTVGKVVVTTPKGGTIVLKPIPGNGYSYFGIAKGNGAAVQCTNSASNNCVSSTTIIRLSAAYLDSAANSTGTGTGAWASTKHPRDIDAAMPWGATCDATGCTGWKNWTDAELAAIPELGTWTFDVYDAAGTTIVTTEKRRTTARAQTLAEVQAITWPKLTDSLMTKLKTDTATTGGFKLDAPNPVYITSDFTVNGGNGWEVPAGAWAPLGVKVYGSYYPNGSSNSTGKISFDDERVVSSSWRKATIWCSAAGNSDQHCNSNGTFKHYVNTTTALDVFGTIQLNGRNEQRVGLSRTVNFRNN